MQREGGRAPSGARDYLLLFYVLLYFKEEGGGRAFFEFSRGKNGNYVASLLRPVRDRGTWKIQDGIIRHWKLPVDGEFGLEPGQLLPAERRPRSLVLFALLFPLDPPRPGACKKQIRRFSPPCREKSRVGKFF